MKHYTTPDGAPSFFSPKGEFQGATLVPCYCTDGRHLQQALEHRKNWKGWRWISAHASDWWLPEGWKRRPARWVWIDTSKPWTWDA